MLIDMFIYLFLFSKNNCIRFDKSMVNPILITQARHRQHLENCLHSLDTFLGKYLYFVLVINHYNINKYGLSFIYVYVYRYANRRYCSCCRRIKTSC